MEERGSGNVGHRRANLLSCMNDIYAKRINSIPPNVIPIHSGYKDLSLMVVNEKAPNHSSTWDSRATYSFRGKSSMSMSIVLFSLSSLSPNISWTKACMPQRNDHCKFLISFFFKNHRDQPEKCMSTDRHGTASRWPFFSWSTSLHSINIAKFLEISLICKP